MAPAAMCHKMNLSPRPLCIETSHAPDARDLLDLTAPASLSKRKGPAEEINMFYRHAQGSTIYGGTSEIMKEVISRSI